MGVNRIPTDKPDSEQVRVIDNVEIHEFIKSFFFYLFKKEEG